ncbi:zinc transporter ZIP1-like [Periplaneta americana]|uniref:zinc transporter ZIP1-like n=1 Tax=Periplaneta americana TaxID=6978 RepID=UPI0037E71933
MDILIAKVTVLVILLIVTFLFSMLPLKLMSKYRHAEDQSQRIRYGHIISGLSCFAGGVFMGTGLLDLFPEVDEILSKANVHSYIKSSFPVAEFTVAFGFLLVLILEQIVQDFKERQIEYNRLQDESRQQRASESHDSEGRHHEVEVGPLYEEPPPHPALRSVMLLLALSLHSLLEGLAVGLQSDMSYLIQIFVAVVLHKVIIAFSLGLNLVQTELSAASIVKSNLLFSITSPLGIGIALALEEFGHNLNSSMVNGVLQGLACGTFVYVTFFEVLPHELNKGEYRLFKLLALLFGFSIVCCVLFLDPAEAPSCLNPQDR